MKKRASTAAVLLGLALTSAAWADESHHMHEAVGATVEDLVAIARRMNPDLQVSALEADAAAARVMGSDSLADPKIVTQVMDWPRNRPGFLPSNPLVGTTKKIFLSQELPFWGKRDLRREIAEANARKASLMRLQVESELVAKIKTAYAEYHAAHLTGDVARDLKGRLETVVRIAQARYAQGMGKQQDVTRAEVEKSVLEAEIARTDGERQKTRAKINRLLGRAPDGALVETPAPRLIPPMETLSLPALMERAQQSNPEIQVQQMAIEGSEKAVALAEKSWYPDFEVSLGAVRSQGDWSGYEAMVSANIPLRGSLRESEIGESKAMAAAGRSRKEALAQDAATAVAQSWIDLKTARRLESLLRESQIPQAEIGFKAAVRGYELGRSEFLDVLTAEQQLWRSNIDLIKTRFDEQMRLAEIEKMIGGEL